MAFIHPDLFAVLSKIAPPSQPNQQPASNILNHPKVNSCQHGNNNKDKHFWKDETKEKVANNGEHLEYEGGNTSEWMCGHVEVVSVGLRFGRLLGVCFEGLLKVLVGLRVFVHFAFGLGGVGVVGRGGLFLFFHWEWIDLGWIYNGLFILWV